jgi:hypothetical protein
MNLDKIVAITGMSGIFKLKGQNKSGLVVEDLQTRKQSFVPTRGHNLSPLDTIGMYTNNNDTKALKEVFSAMRDQLATNPPPDTKAATEVLTTYFETVMPDFDRERVRPNDIKKAIKWFAILHQAGLTADVADEDAAVDQVESTKPAEDVPAT